MKTEDLVNETLGRVAENADADNALKNASHRTATPITVVPHMAGMIDTGAAERARQRNEATDANLSSIPKFEKP